MAVIVTISFIFLTAVIASVVTLSLNRRAYYILWGFIGSLLVDSPYILALFGVTNLYGLLLFSHTVGIFLFPIILAFFDVLLIELSLLKYLKPIKWILPKYLKNAVIFEAYVERLQKYHTVPRPVRVHTVYIIGVVSGVTNLVVSLALGMI